MAIKMYDGKDLEIEFRTIEFKDGGEWFTTLEPPIYTFKSIFAVSEKSEERGINSTDRIYYEHIKADNLVNIKGRNEVRPATSEEIRLAKIELDIPGILDDYDRR